MEIILTKRLLGALIKNGYYYFLSKTSLADPQDSIVYVMLRPVKTHPLLHQLPGSYQRYYKVSQELLQMATGINGVCVKVELKGVCFGQKLQYPGLSKKSGKNIFSEL